MSERYRVIENGMITRRGPGWDVHDGPRVIASAWDEADAIAVCAALNEAIADVARRLAEREVAETK